MKVVIASDHAGFELKEKIKEFLKAHMRFDVADLGADSPESVDYPDFAHRVAEKLARGEADRAVLVCGSGIGMCMAANRHRGVRAAVIRDRHDAEMSRSHNDANVACIGARITAFPKCRDLLRIWFGTPFEGGGRHARRVTKIDTGCRFNRA